MRLNIETLEQFAADVDLLLSDNLINFANMVSEATEWELKQRKKPKAVKPKADALPDNWQGSGRYKLYDAATKTHFEADFEQAMLHKGLTAKKVFSWKSDTKDRDKDFKSGSLIRYAQQDLIQSYVNEWLKLNNLKAA